MTPEDTAVPLTEGTNTLGVLGLGNLSGESKEMSERMLET